MMKFNTTKIKKLGEKKLLNQEININYILPLISIEGLLYLTDERIYIQPLHPSVLQGGKSIVKFKIKNVKELFKRRYTL